MEQKLYAIHDFLNAYPISKASLYRLWRKGRGPKIIRIGHRTFISVKSAEEWVNGLEQHNK